MQELVLDIQEGILPSAVLAAELGQEQVAVRAVVLPVVLAALLEGEEAEPPLPCVVLLPILYQGGT